ncbi:MAG: hypothetical protein HQL51_15785 [Magnetococcales bacterium]|nr:hypothetical protein [Magnetococcales bacterium]
MWRNPNGRLLLVKPNDKAFTTIVELNRDGNYYDVVTAGVFKKQYVSGGGRELLWSRARVASQFSEGDPEPLMRWGQSSEEGKELLWSRAHTSRLSEDASEPLWRWGQSSEEKNTTNPPEEGRNFSGEGQARAATSAASGMDKGVPPEGGWEMPELVELAHQLMRGEYPSVRKKLKLPGHGNVLGYFRGQGAGEIKIRADQFADLHEATKTLSHEIGHLVDWLPDQDMKRGNLLGHVASLKGHMKDYLESKPGGPGLLTEKDRARLRREAEKLSKTPDREELVDEEIRRTMPVTPDEVLKIWDFVESGEPANPALIDFINRLTAEEKKRIIKEALKGRVTPELQRFAQVILEKTGDQVVVKIPGGQGTLEEIRKIYQELIEKEVEKRRLFSNETIKQELRELTRQWSPFDPEADAKYTAYRYRNTELYAEAVSVLFSNPQLLNRVAPEFARGFHAYMERKPELQKIWWAIETARNSGWVAADRVRRVREMFDNAEDQYAATLNPSTTWRERRDMIGAELVDRHYKLLRLEKEAGETKARNAIEEMLYTGSEAEGYLAEINERVIRPLRKAGLTETDLGEYLFHQRIARGDRHDLANPLGFTPEISAGRLAEMEGKSPALVEVEAAFRDVRQEWVTDKLMKAQVHGQELLDRIHDNESYATFDVAKYIEQRYGREASAHIHQQVGTLNEIGNPLTATLAKDVSVIWGINRQLASRAAVTMLAKHYPELLQKADTRWNGKIREIVPPSDPAKGLIVFAKDGQALGWYVDKAIADAFGKNPFQGGIAVQALALANKPFKLIFTQANPGFWLSNLVRDYQRNILNLPGAGAINMALAYTRAIRPAYRAALGIPDPVIKEMQQGKMLISTVDFAGLSAEDTALERLLQKHGLERKTWEGTIMAPFAGLWRHLEVFAKATENLGKVAGYDYLRRHAPTMDPAELAHQVRVRAGSPAFLRKGGLDPLTNNIILFFNAAKEGWRGSIEVARERPGEFAWKLGAYYLAPKALMWAAKIGLLGMGVQYIMDGATEFDLANYYVIPLGTTGAGKSVYLRIPQDETGRFVGGVFWKASHLAGDTRWGDLFDYASGHAPGAAPPISAAIDIAAYLSGKNPYDNYRGQLAVPETAFEAGGWQSHQEMLKFLWNRNGGGILHVFRGEDARGVQSELEQFLNFPIVSNLVGRFLKVTDAGIHEQAMRVWREVREGEAREILAAREGARNMVEGGSPTPDEAVAMARHADAVGRKLQHDLLTRYGDRWIVETMAAKSSAERAAVLQRLQELGRIPQ